MALRINTNIAAINAHRQLLGTEQRLGVNMERLSSGYRINRSADDAAGLAVANRLRTNTRSLTVASRNVSEARAMVGIAEGASNQVEGILERMKELATQAASDNAALDRSKINSEFSKLQDEITRIVEDTEYQGTVLLKGTFGNISSSTTTEVATTSFNVTGAASGTYTFTVSGSSMALQGTDVTQTITFDTNGGEQNLHFDKVGITINTATDFVTACIATGEVVVVSAPGEGTFQVGSGGTSNVDTIGLSLGDLQITGLGSGTGSMISDVSLLTRSTAQDALTIIDDAIDDVGVVLGDIGAAVNRMDYTYSNLQVTVENFAASESVIRDVDMAYEMIGFTKNQILLQAGTAMLAQANMSTQGVLSLMG